MLAEVLPLRVTGCFTTNETAARDAKNGFGLIDSTL
jgi:hypothetical protein